MAADVDAYISGAPEQAREKLERLRRIILTVAPEATERISYGMPYYGYKGQLAYFALHKTHIGLYVPPPVIANHRRELEEYETSKATVRFPLNEALPASLIKKLIKARMEINSQHSPAKRSR